MLQFNTAIKRSWAWTRWVVFAREPNFKAPTLSVLFAPIFDHLIRALTTSLIRDIQIPITDFALKIQARNSIFLQTRTCLKQLKLTGFFLSSPQWQVLKFIRHPADGRWSFVRPKKPDDCDLDLKYSHPWTFKCLVWFLSHRFFLHGLANFLNIQLWCSAATISDAFGIFPWGICPSN